MDLYKIIGQLTEEEYHEIHSNFIANKAEKTADFLELIRSNPEDPDKEFIQRHDISPSAFYVLKSRLNQRIETFLLNRLGDSNLHVMRRVLNIGDLVANNPREISVAALRRLEKELLKFDFPYGLMIVYKALQNLHTFDEKYIFYKSHYNQQVAYAVAMDKAVDLVIQFFRAFDSYYLSRKDKDHNEMIRIMEKIVNVTSLYESNRLMLFKYIVHIYAKLHIEIPENIRCEVEDLETMFDKSLEILGEYKEDSFYANLNILFNFFRFIHYENNGVYDKSKIYFEILDYKIEEMLLNDHYNANLSLYLFRKLKYHKRTQTNDQLIKDVADYIDTIEIEPYRLSYFVNFHLFRAYAYFNVGRHKKVTRILYNLRNEVNLRKQVHLDLEVKFFHALSYVMIKEFDLANQLILSLQRQLRKDSMKVYEHAKILIKILNVALGGRPRTRYKNLKNNVDQWNETNVGRYAILEHLDMENIFLTEEFVETEAAS